MSSMPSDYVYYEYHRHEVACGECHASKYIVMKIYLGPRKRNSSSYHSDRASGILIHITVIGQAGRVGPVPKRNDLRIVTRAFASEGGSFDFLGAQTEKRYDRPCTLRACSDLVAGVKHPAARKVSWGANQGLNKQTGTSSRLHQGFVFCPRLFKNALFCHILLSSVKA